MHITHEKNKTERPVKFSKNFPRPIVSEGPFATLNLRAHKLHTDIKQNKEKEKEKAIKKIISPRRSSLELWGVGEKSSPQMSLHWIWIEKDLFH